MTPSTPAPARDMAEAMDRADPLAPFRARFHLPGEGALYMDGNSLGLQPLETAAVVERALSAWRDEQIIAWREWIRAPRRIGDLIASAIVQAQPGEIVVGDSTSVNLYKAVAAAIVARPGRRRLVTSDDNFPTDLYVLQSLAAQHGLDLQVLAADPVEGLDAQQLARALDADVALVALSHIAYRSGALLDMEELTRAAHGMGALTLWDVSHSAGSARVPLQSSGADLAVGCTYKYLNGGPGAPSFVYVRESQQAAMRQPLWGWFGHRRQFDMPDAFEPAEGIDAFLVGIPAILSTLAIEPGVRSIADAGVARLQEKGRRLTELIVALADEWLAPHGFSVVSPRDALRRGSHVTLRHPRAKDFVRGLIARRVTPDFRPPDMIRLGPAPVYTRFVDVWDAMQRLRELAQPPR
jgi:kynureninase